MKSIYKKKLQYNEKYLKEKNKLLVGSRVQITPQQEERERRMRSAELTKTKQEEERTRRIRKVNLERRTKERLYNEIIQNHRNPNPEYNVVSDHDYINILMDNNFFEYDDNIINHIKAYSRSLDPRDDDSYQYIQIQTLTGNYYDIPILLSHFIPQESAQPELENSLVLEHAYRYKYNNFKNFISGFIGINVIEFDLVDANDPNAEPLQLQADNFENWLTYYYYHEIMIIGRIFNYHNPIQLMLIFREQ